MIKNIAEITKIVGFEIFHIFVYGALQEDECFEY